MTDRALSQDAMLAGLRDIRLPDTASGGTLAEFLVVFGSALIAAVVVAALFRMAMLRRTVPAKLTVSQKILALDTLPEDARRRTALALLKVHAPDRFAAIGQSLFNPETSPPTDALIAELRSHV